jgi:hypothetical protein
MTLHWLKDSWDDFALFHQEQFGLVDEEQVANDFALVDQEQLGCFCIG